MQKQRIVLKYKQYIATAEVKPDGHYITQVRGFPGEFFIHAATLEDVKTMFHQFADLQEAREKKTRQKEEYEDRYESHVAADSFFVKPDPSEMTQKAQSGFCYNKKTDLADDIWEDISFDCENFGHAKRHSKYTPKK